MINEVRKMNRKIHGVSSFDKLWEKLEPGKITESECFGDLSRLEYLELEKEKVEGLKLL